MSDSDNRNVVTMGAEIVRVRHTLAVDNIYNRDVATMAEIVLRVSIQLLLLTTLTEPTE